MYIGQAIVSASESIGELPMIDCHLMKQRTRANGKKHDEKSIHPMNFSRRLSFMATFSVDKLRLCGFVGGNTFSIKSE